MAAARMEAGSVTNEGGKSDHGAGEVRHGFAGEQKFVQVPAYGGWLAGETGTSLPGTRVRSS